MIAATALALLAAGCGRNGGTPAPARDTSPADLPDRTSTIVVPVSASLAELEAGLNARVPTALWSIDRREKKCVPAQRVKVLGIRAKVLPDIACRIVGQVTRGRMRLSGQGNRLILTMPVSARVSAQDIGGIIKRETATGRADVRAVVALSVDGQWQPRAKVDIAYDWTDPPGVDVLGQRIRFASRADAKLQGVIARLERELPGELAKLRTRERLEGLWRQGFTSIELNREKPPAWMRVSPRKLGFGGYQVRGGRLEMVLAAEALTETFVGDRPPDPQPTPLPPPSKHLGDKGLRFFIPVLADFRQLEPVVQRALRKRAAKGIDLAGIGPVDAEFGKVTIYATAGGRLAVGVEAKAKARRGVLPETKGDVWLTGIPYNEPNSQRVRVRDLRLTGSTDRETVNLLINLFLDPTVLGDLQNSLTEDFAPDYNRVLAAARRAVSERREGDFVLSSDIRDVKTGLLTVTGQGLFLPVEAEGTASIRYDPVGR